MTMARLAMQLSADDPEKSVGWAKETVRATKIVLEVRQEYEGTEDRSGPNKRG